AQIGAVERRLQRHQGIEVLGHLPQQEVAVSPEADQPIGPQQQTPVEALDRLAELDLRARLALGGEPAPRVVELVEGEADDLPLLRLRAHETNLTRSALLLPDLLQHQNPYAPETQHMR